MRAPFHTGLRKLEDAVKGESVARHLSRLKKMKEADPEFIHSYQLRAIKKLIVYAYNNTTFYRQRFDEQGVQPDDIQSFDDFARLRPVTREDIQAHGGDIISKEFRQDALRSGYSSGSTGEPITFYHDKQAYSAGRAAVLAGLELAGKRLGDKTITLWGNRDTVKEEWSKPGSRFKAWLYRNKRFPVDRFIEESYFQEILDVLIAQRGGFVSGYSQPIYLTACYAKERGVELERKFDGVLTTAEKIFPYQRDTIEEIFGPVFDSYGSREILGKAYQCRERKGYHVVEPNIIFEKGDSEGEAREVIVTDLWNYAWPLIRYNIGDLFSGEFGTCDCGCTWKTFDTIVGRINEIIRLPDGGLIHPMFWVVNDLMKYIAGIKQIQLARVAENKYVFRLQAFEGENATFMDGFRDAVAKHFKGISDFDVELVDSFPVGQSGKHRPIVDEVKFSPTPEKG